MLRGNALHLVFILCVYMQVNVHGGTLTAIKDKVAGIGKNDDEDKPPGPIAEGCNMCVWGSCTPAVKPLPEVEFSESADVRVLLKAIRGRILVNKKSIAEILTSRSETQRKAIGESFQTKTKVVLARMLIYKLTFRSRFTQLMLALATPLPDFYMIQFKRALRSQNDQIKSEEGRIAMIEMFTTLSPCLIRKIKATYNFENGRNSFATDIQTFFENFPQTDYIDVFKALAQGDRDDDVKTSWPKAMQDAIKMKEAIETQNWNNQKEVFREIFTKRSIPQLKETIKVYEKLRNNAEGYQSLYDDINNQMGSVKEIYATMVKIVKDQHLYFASAIRHIFDINVKVDHIKFINLIRGRCDIDLGDIAEAYVKRYDTSMLTTFHDREKSRGHYYEAMFRIIK